MIVAAICIVGFFFLWLWVRSELKAMSFDAIERNNKQFFTMADQTLSPLKESVQKLAEKQQELESARLGTYAALSKQIDALVSSEKELQRETTRLSQALKSPQVRGSWGELHLKRVVELAGLIQHCDFYEQKTLHSFERTSRPDLIIHLPGDRQIAVDAKTPIHAYLDAADLEDGSFRKLKLEEHAQILRKHIKMLSQKEYWKQFDPAPDYVILFLPAEAFFSAALQSDPSLIEVGASQNIVIATPTTLIAILRAVAYGWKQESLSKSARAICRLGEELYERVGVLSEHWNRVGALLDSSVDAYNKSVASFESRVLVTAKKLKEVGGLSKEVPEVKQIEKTAKSLNKSL